MSAGLTTYCDDLCNDNAWYLMVLMVSVENLTSGEPLLGSYLAAGDAVAVVPLATGSSAAHTALRRLSVDFQHLDNQSHFLRCLGCGCFDGDSAPTGRSVNGGGVFDFDGHGI